MPVVTRVRVARRAVVLAPVVRPVVPVSVERVAPVAPAVPVATVSRVSGRSARRAMRVVLVVRVVRVVPRGLAGFVVMVVRAGPVVWVAVVVMGR